MSSRVVKIFEIQFSQIPSRFRVLLGGHKIYSGAEHRVMNISIHPLYQQFVRGAYDIALLKISPLANYSDLIRPICLPTAPAKINEMCKVTGWGCIKEGGEKAEYLREIHVPILAPAVCNDFEHYAGHMHPPSMIYAGFNEGRVDSCQGDNGGPLQCLNRFNQWELQGVVSWGIGCGQPKFPGIYTNIYNLQSWIKAQMNAIG